jgi:hypothetical protein
MKPRKWIAIGGALLACGCATQKQLVPTGGSRADGTVTLAYEYGAFEVPKVDMSEASRAATQRCAAWGYTGSQPFGGSTSQCQAFNGYGSCLRYLVTVTYQCTGNPPPHS